MDYQDIITFVIVLLLTLIPKKKKTTFETDPLDDPDVIEARKRIEALKRQRNATEQSMRSERPLPSRPSKPVKQTFSAYKHLPKSVEPMENVPLETGTVEPMCSKVQSKENKVQKKVEPKRTKLHEWIIGQVILDTPAYRKNYGNFFNR